MWLRHQHPRAYDSLRVRQIIPVPPTSSTTKGGQANGPPRKACTTWELESEFTTRLPRRWRWIPWLSGGSGGRPYRGRRLRVLARFCGWLALHRLQSNHSRCEMVALGGYINPVQNCTQLVCPFHPGSSRFLQTHPSFRIRHGPAQIRTLSPSRSPEHSLQGPIPSN